uniref:Uncharacterized protein n=1 Tax=Callorhinchus milii TaxID=7868 RepID=A0A4W3K6I1_CALMI
MVELGRPVRRALEHQGAEEGQLSDQKLGGEGVEVVGGGLHMGDDECKVGRSKLHGIKYIFTRRATTHRRMLWVLTFLVSVCLFLIWSLNRVNYLLSHPMLTKVHMMWPQILTYPAVTLCNQNFLRHNKMTSKDRESLGRWLDLSPAPRPASRRRRLSSHQYFPPTDQEVNTTELVDRLSHQIQDMLLACRFQGQICAAHNFTSIFTRNGKCYTFNSGLDGNPLLTTLKGGTGNGLEIMLDIQQDEYLPVWDKTETSFEAGIKVQIHSQDEPPIIDQLGFGIAPGFQTFVSCQQQRLMYLPSPWGDCKSTPIDSEFFSTYSLTACRIDCETRYLVKNCNCRMVHMPGTRANMEIQLLGIIESTGKMKKKDCGKWDLEMIRRNTEHNRLIGHVPFTSRLPHSQPHHHQKNPQNLPPQLPFTLQTKPLTSQVVLARQVAGSLPDSSLNGKLYRFTWLNSVRRGCEESMGL